MSKFIIRKILVYRLGNIVTSVYYNEENVITISTYIL